MLQAFCFRVFIVNFGLIVLQGYQRKLRNPQFGVLIILFKWLQLIARRLIDLILRKSLTTTITFCLIKVALVIRDFVSLQTGELLDF